MPEPVGLNPFLPGDASPRPWRRYFARMIDTGLIWLALTVVVGFVIGFVVGPSGLWVFEDDGLFPRVLVMGALMLPIEAVMLAWWGTTPGKAMLGLRVIDRHGARLSFGVALRRALRVWVHGLGLNFPLASLITLIVAHGKLTRQQVTSWDRALGSSVRYMRG